MDKETIKYIIKDFQEKPLPEVKKRQIELPLDLNRIITLIGIRRSGKTYLLYHTIQRLLKRNVDKRNIVYLNFEDDRMFPVKLDEMDLILRAYHEMYPEKISEKKYLFLDEIQRLSNWEKYVRRIYDTESIQIFLTGSSSKISSRKVSSSLRGRTTQYEVFPLSFKEYLDFKGISVIPYSTSSEIKIHSALDEYLIWGGFPEVVLTENHELRRKILHEYSDLIFYKDLIEQYGIHNQYLMKYLIKHLMVNPSMLISIHKLYNDLRSQGISLSKNALYEYVEYLREAYVIFSTSKYSSSIRVQRHNPDKYYVIDTGLIGQFSPGLNKDIVKKMENAVYLQLRRKRESEKIYYYKNSFEIDFVYPDNEHLEIMNVSYTVTDSRTSERETGGLIKGKIQFSDARVKLITNEYNKSLIPENVPVEPAWKFLIK